MVGDQQGFDFDPAIHTQPPPVVNLNAPPRRSPARPAPEALSPVQPQQAVEGLPSARLIDMAKAVRTILATRVLLLLCILVASAIWGITSWQPSELRIVAACAYSSLVLWPLVWLYFKKG